MLQTNSSLLRIAMTTGLAVVGLGAGLLASVTHAEATAITTNPTATWVASEGNGNSLHAYWQEAGQTNWNTNVVPVAPQDSTYSASTTTSDSTTVWIAAEGANNSLLVYSIPADSTTGQGTEETVGGTGSTFSRPCITYNSGDGSVWVTAEGADNSLDFYSQAEGQTTWSEETVAGSDTTYSPPSIAAASATGSTPNAVWITAQGATNSLDFYWQAVGSTTWNPETVSTIRTNSTPSIVDGAGSVWITSATNTFGGDLYFFVQDWAAGQDTWSQELVSPHEVAYSSSSITYADGSAWIVAEGGGASLYVYTQAIGQHRWFSEKLGGRRTAESQFTPGQAGPSITSAGDTLWVLTKGGEKDLLAYTETVGTTTWTRSTVASPGGGSY